MERFCYIIKILAGSWENLSVDDDLSWRRGAKTRLSVEDLSPSHEGSLDHTLEGPVEIGGHLVLVLDPVLLDGVLQARGPDHQVAVVAGLDPPLAVVELGQPGGGLTQQLIESGDCQASPGAQLSSSPPQGTFRTRLKAFSSK